METVLYLLYQVAGLAPIIPLDDQLRPTWLFGDTVHDGCDRAASYEQGDFAADYNSPPCRVSLVVGGPSSTAPSPSGGGWPASAAAPTWAASASAARCPASPTSSCRSWTSRREPTCQPASSVCMAPHSARSARGP